MNHKVIKDEEDYTDEYLKDRKDGRVSIEL